jgi:aspartyl-tRNA(Asn)/glutamyl-tRNA(Gln) amidotransferase subunit A
MSVFTSPPAAGDVFRYDVQDYLSKLGPTSSFDSIQSFEQHAGFAFGEGSLTRPVQALANSIEGDIFEDPGFIAEVLWQKQLLDTFRAIMDAKDLDALIYPYSFITVPSLGGPNNFPLAVPEVSLMGIPLVTVPVDLYDSGAPFAVTVIGRDKWTDEQILGYAYALEQALLGQGKGRFAPTAIPEPGGLAIMLLTAGMLLLRTDTRRAMDRSAGDSVAA